MSLEQNFIKVCQQISLAKTKYNRIHGISSTDRSLKNVRLLAVSKKKPAEMVRAIWEMGQRDFGENYIKEAVDKINQLNDLSDIQWHLIGPLQSNKTKDVAEHFDWVHTIERLKVAQRLNMQRPKDKSPLNVCIQINISHQASKAGITEDELFVLAEEIIALPRLRLRGLMTIPAPVDFSISDEVATLRKDFQAMRHLYFTMQQRYPNQQIDTLSMGMSRDLSLAIEEGSNLVRVGTALFGERK